MGLDATILGRLSTNDLNARRRDKTMQFVWRPMFDTLGESAQIFTHVLNDRYASPPGMDWDIVNSEDPFVGDETLSTYNAP
jgi:Glycosyl hydrolases family 38 N-terminal domain